MLRVLLAASPAYSDGTKIDYAKAADYAATVLDRINGVCPGFQQQATLGIAMLLKSGKPGGWDRACRDNMER